MANTRGQFQVEFLRSIANRGGRIESARFSLQRGPLKSIEPIYSLTLEQGQVRSLQEFPWTSELETYLLESRQRMETPADEADRFAAILLHNIQVSAAKFGRDFTHAVLVVVLAERTRYPLSALLSRAGTAKPNRSGRHFQECTQVLGGAVDQLHKLAEVALGYQPQEAEALMIKALEITLDETFHISGTDLMFPKHH
ncbi:MAG TPA: hypothetical protein VNO30_35175 [Kofleriaceae bacterium]|nr:hypothetical protein [Kofleriaceae bacterium]